MYDSADIWLSERTEMVGGVISISNLAEKKLLATNRLLQFILFASSIYLMLATLDRSKFGFDITDEAYYQIWMAMPSLYKASSTQFGFVYHYVYDLFNGNIVYLRIFNYLLTLSFAWLAAFSFLCKANPGNSGFNRIVMSTAIAIAALTQTAFELPQGPSYNTLAFQAVLLGATAIGFMSGEKWTLRSVLCWLGLALAGSLAFLAKPPTGVLLGAAVVGYFIPEIKHRASQLFVTALASIGFLLGFSLLLNLGSPVDLEKRIKDAIDLGSVMAGSTHAPTLIRWDGLPFGRLESAILMLGAALIGTIVAASITSKRFSHTLCAFAVPTICILAIVFVTLPFPFSEPLGRYKGMQFFMVLLGSAGAFSALGKWNTQILRNLIFLTILPLAYAWGTGRPIWLNVEGANFFWLLGAVYLILSIEIISNYGIAALFVASTSLLGSALFLSSSWEFPYRQFQPLRADNFELEIGPGKGTLKVARDLGVYISSMRKLAAKGGFKKGTAVIDLTGVSPGTVFLIGGVPPGAVWLSGGYPGSEAYALKTLALAGCQTVQKAWIITEKSDHALAAADITREFGLDIGRDYEDLGAVTTTEATYTESYNQHLLRPKADNPTIKCKF